MIHLVNSAIMPAEGFYHLQRLTLDEFTSALQQVDSGDEGFRSFLYLAETET